MPTLKQKQFKYSQPSFYLKTIEELKDAEERVAWLLKGNEHLRNCDICLVFEFWKAVDRLGPCEFDHQETRHDLTMFETIRRVRQHIQNDIHIWPPTDEQVIEKRGIKQDAFRDWARMNKGLGK